MDAGGRATQEQLPRNTLGAIPTAVTATRSYAYWRGLQKRSMRQLHKAGEKCFVDYCGPALSIVCAATGEIHPAQVFVAVLGGIQLHLCRGDTESVTAGLAGQPCAGIRVLWRGYAMPVVLDNLRSGVTRACRYDPDLNASYQQWAEHYQVVAVPARPYKPKDKAKAKVGVQIVER